MHSQWCTRFNKKSGVWVIFIKSVNWSTRYCYRGIAQQDVYNECNRVILLSTVETGAELGWVYVTDSPWSKIGEDCTRCHTFPECDQLKNVIALRIAQLFPITVFAEETRTLGQHSIYWNSQVMQETRHFIFAFVLATDLHSRCIRSLKHHPTIDHAIS